MREYDFVESTRMRLDKNPAIVKVIPGMDEYAYKLSSGLFVIQSIAEEQDGNIWVHTSFSRKSRMPGYNDMAMVKNIFIGDNMKAIMVIPERKFHVNIHEYCLHFYTPISHDPLPEFSWGSGSI